MVSQKEVDIIQMELSNCKQQAFNSEKEINTLKNKYDARGKTLNKLWEKNKELKKELVKLQKLGDQVTAHIKRLTIENRLIIPSRQSDIPGTQILVRDLLKQLINESGYDLQFRVLQIRYPTKRVRTKPTSTITGKQIKK